MASNFRRTQQSAQYFLAGLLAPEVAWGLGFRAAGFGFTFGGGEGLPGCIFALGYIGL